MSKYNDQYNLVLGSQPQLPVAVLGPNDKFDSRRIPHNVADGTIRVSGGKVTVGRGPAATARATLDVGGNLVVDGNVTVIHGTIFGQVGECEISVKDCGAAADGVTDDTAAFQACLDGDVPTILVPPGSYAIHGTIFVRRPVRIVGFPGSVLMRRGTAPQDPMIVVGSVEETVGGVEMRGLEFSSTRIPNGNAPFFSDDLDFLHGDNKQACLALVRVDGAIFVDCTIRGFARGVVTSNGRATSGLGVRALTFERCVFDEYNVALLTNRATDVRVAQCTFRGQRILEGEDAGEAHAWFNVGAAEALVLDDVFFEDLEGGSPAVHWRHVDGGSASTLRVRSIDALARVHECRHVRLHSVVGDCPASVGDFIAVTSETALLTSANPDRYDVEVSDVHVRLASRAVHVDHHDVVCVRDCVFSYADEIFDAVIRATAHFLQGHNLVLRNLTVRFKNVVPTTPVASLHNATLDTLTIVSDIDAYTEDMEITSYVACVGSFESLGSVQLWIEQGLTRRAPTTTVWNVRPDASVSGAASNSTTAFPALTLEPIMARGLLASSTSAHGATAVPRHDDSTVRIQLKGGRSASSLHTVTNKAPMIDGVYDSRSNRVSEYSHALSAPPAPGAFTLRIAFYVDAAFAASIPLDQSTPFFFLPWTIPGYASDALLQSHLYVNSERDVILYYRTAWYDTAANTKRSSDGHREIAVNAWHELVLTYRRTSGYTIALSLDDMPLIDRAAVSTFPFADGVYVGSHGWKQGVWIGEIAYETLEPSVMRSRAPLYEENGPGTLVVRDGNVDVRGNVRMGAIDGPVFAQGGRTSPPAMSHAIPIADAASSGLIIVHARAPGLIAIFQLGFLRPADDEAYELTSISTFKNTSDVLFEISGTMDGALIQYVAPTTAAPFTIAWTVIGA